MISTTCFKRKASDMFSTGDNVLDYIPKPAMAILGTEFENGELQV